MCPVDHHPGHQRWWFMHPELHHSYLHLCCRGRLKWTRTLRHLSPGSSQPGHLVHMSAPQQHRSSCSSCSSPNRQCRHCVTAPTNSLQYKQHMGGVDLSDQLIQYYSVHHKTARWYRTILSFSGHCHHQQLHPAQGTLSGPAHKGHDTQGIHGGADC